MVLGDILFIASFVLLPVAIVIAGIWALRSLGKARSVRTVETTILQTTEEFPLVPGPDWTGSVQPAHADPVSSSATIEDPAPRTYRVPDYRGRSGGIVKRTPAGSNHSRRRTRPGGSKQDRAA